MSDLVVMSLEVWDEVWRRNQHLVAGLLRSGQVRRVLFVEPPADTLHELRSGRVSWSGARGTGLRRIRLAGAGSTELWGLRPRKLLPRRIDSGGDRRRARRIAETARGLGFTRPVLWVNDPGGAEVLAQTGWPALYDITDDWLVADRPEAELARLRRQEAQLMTQCRAVVVCSPALQRTRSTEREVVLVANAVDLDPYRTLQPRPGDLPAGPVALYLGTVHRDRVDVGLCVTTARRLAQPDTVGGAASLVLVGPAPLPPDDLTRMREAGVLVLGPRPSPTVPAYLQHADVLLVPHVLTDFTASLDPIKAYEYRAAGRPVVSTPVPGFLDSGDPRVLAVETTGFPDAVARACADPQPWGGGPPADIPSWDDRVRQMADVIGEVRGGAG